jgi:hypothetical protein
MVGNMIDWTFKDISEDGARLDECADLEGLPFKMIDTQDSRLIVAFLCHM